jgi:HEAT repeat protein
MVDKRRGLQQVNTNRRKESRMDLPHSATPELSLPKLIAGLKSPDRGERFQSAYRIGQMGPQAARAVIPLVDALLDGDKHVRKMAVVALGDIGAEAAPAVAALGRILRNDPEETVRRRAAVALGEIGALEAIDVLEDACSADESDEVREAAVDSLVQLELAPVSAAA